MKKYPDEFFENMKFKIHGVAHVTDLMELFPSLRDHKEFNVSSLHWNEVDMDYDRNTLLRYIFYCYDESLIWEFPDMQSRKEFCLKLSGYTTKDKDIMERLINNELPQVNDMILVFFKIQNNRKHRWRLQAMDLLDQYDRIIMKPIDSMLDDDKVLRAANLKTTLMKDTWSFIKDLDEIDKEFFGSSEEAKVITTKRQRTTPETRAKKE